MTEEWVDAVLAYGMEPEVLEEFPFTVQKARSVRDVLKLRTTAGAKMLKRAAVDRQGLDTVFDAVEYAAHQLLSAPRFIRTVYGDPYVATRTGLYYVTRWIDAREADFRKPEELVAGAATLGKWHNAMDGFGRSRSIPSRAGVIHRMQQALQELQNEAHAARNTANGAPFDRLFAACAEELEERMKAAVTMAKAAGLADAETAAIASGAMCHGHFIRQNVVFDGEAYTVLNYERVHPGLPEADLAMYLHRYMPSHEWDPDVLSQAVEAYATACKRAFQPASLAAILTAPLRSIQIASWYYGQAKDWDEDDYLDTLEASVQLEEVRQAAVDEVLSPRVSDGNNAGLSLPRPAATSSGQLPSVPDTGEGSYVVIPESRDEPLQIPVDSEETTVTLTTTQQLSETGQTRPAGDPAQSDAEMPEERQGLRAPAKETDGVGQNRGTPARRKKALKPRKRRRGPDRGANESGLWRNPHGKRLE